MDTQIVNKVAVTKALFEILKNKPLDDVTVQEICTVAGISRQTFYRVFENKYDAANWYLLQIEDRTIAQVGITLSWRDATLHFFQEIGAARSFVEAIDRSMSPSPFNILSRARAESYMFNAYRLRYKAEPAKNIAFEIRIFTIIAPLSVREWFDNDCTPSADEYTSWFLELIPSNLKRALDITSKQDGHRLSIDIY